MIPLPSIPIVSLLIFSLSPRLLLLILSTRPPLVLRSISFRLLLLPLLILCLAWLILCLACLILCRFLLRNELPSISRSESTGESFATSECSETPEDSEDCERGGDNDESEWKEAEDGSEEDEEKEPGLVRNDSQIGNTLDRFTNEVEEWEEGRDGGNDDTDEDEDNEGERNWEDGDCAEVDGGGRGGGSDLVTLIRAAYFDAQKDSSIFEGN